MPRRPHTLCPVVLAPSSRASSSSHHLLVPRRPRTTTSSISRLPVRAWAQTPRACSRRAGSPLPLLVPLLLVLSPRPPLVPCRHRTTTTTLLWLIAPSPHASLFSSSRARAQTPTRWPSLSHMRPCMLSSSIHHHHSTQLSFLPC